MATITKRNEGQWQAKIRKKGYAVQTKTFKTKAMASTWARNVESEMDRGVFMSTSIAENTYLSELVGRYLTEVAPSKKSEADIKVRGKLLKGKLGDRVLAAITPLTVKEFRDMRLETVKGDTVRKEMSLLSRILKLAQQEWDIYLTPLIQLPCHPRARSVTATYSRESKSACERRPKNMGVILKILSI